jgi:hypothetical protein
LRPLCALCGLMSSYGKEREEHAKVRKEC